MTFEIRQAKKEEMKHYRRMMAEAFLPPDVEDPDIELPAAFTLCAFENGKMATSYVSLPFTMQYNGREQKVAGISGISTTAEYRRRGYLRKITEKHFGQLKEEGKRPIAILWAAHAAIYQRYGYATVSNVNSYNVEPRYLQFPLGQPLNGECRVSGRDEFELLNKIYYQSIKEKTGYLHRSEITWKIGPLAPITKGVLFKILVYEEAGIPLGYVIYTVGKHPIQEPFQPHMQVQIRDLVWLTPSALQAIWEVFANQDLVRTVFWQFVPSDDPLPYLLLEPRMLNQRPYDGLMGRIVDVEKGLTGRGYDDEAKLTFEIVDDFCPWNQGTWCLETAKEGSHIKSTTESPDLVMPVSTLAMLAFGHISATRAAAIGRLDVKNDKSLADWDRVMKTIVNPHCPDEF
jgi:predicted acetyltransferase